MAKKEENRRFPAYLTRKEAKWRNNCIASIKSFLELTTGCKKLERIEEYTPIAEKYFSEDRDHADDIIQWKKNSGLAPKTLQVYRSCVQEFLKSGGVVLDDEDLKDLKKAFRGGEEVVEDAPDKAQIRSFLEHGDVRMKAIVYLASSTGLRMGEIVSLTEKNFDFDLRMITIFADDSKNKKGRVTFYTKEAEKALNEWVRGKGKYIADKNKVLASFTTVDRTTKDDGRIFPYDQTGLNRAWNQIVKKAGMDKKNKLGCQVFHPHTLRQFFSTQLRRQGCPDSFVEALLGHAGYLPTYTRYSKQEKLDLYDQYSSALVIGKADDVQRTVNALAEKAEEQNGKVRQLEIEKETLIQRVQDLERRQQAMTIVDKEQPKFTAEDHAAIAKILLEQMKKDQGKS
jgi:integrase